MIILRGTPREPELLSNGSVHGWGGYTGSCNSLINTFWSLLEILIYRNSSTVINQWGRRLLLFNCWHSNRIAHLELTLVSAVILCGLRPNQLYWPLCVSFIRIALLISQNLFLKDLPQIVVLATTSNLDFSFPKGHVVICLMGTKHCEISHSTSRHQVVVIW